MWLSPTVVKGTFSSCNHAVGTLDLPPLSVSDVLLLAHMPTGLIDRLKQVEVESIQWLLLLHAVSFGSAIGKSGVTFSCSGLRASQDV